MKNDLNQWWAGLSSDDRDLFIQHRDTSPLPAEVARRFAESGQRFAVAGWVNHVDSFTADWPGPVYDFLQEKAAQQAA